MHTHTHTRTHAQTATPTHTRTHTRTHTHTQAHADCATKNTSTAISSSQYAHLLVRHQARCPANHWHRSAKEASTCPCKPANRISPLRTSSESRQDQHALWTRLLQCHRLASSTLWRASGCLQPCRGKPPQTGSMCTPGRLTREQTRASIDTPYLEQEDGVPSKDDDRVWVEVQHFLERLVRFAHVALNDLADVMKLVK
jgi:hypothetical protein